MYVGMDQTWKRREEKNVEEVTGKSDVSLSLSLYTIVKLVKSSGVKDNVSLWLK